MTAELIRQQPVSERVTLLFTDIVESTELTVRLGDREALRVMEDHNALVRAACAEMGGMEVEQKGDAFLLAFPTATAGVACAVRIQRAMARYRATHDEPLRVRAGLHTGRALRSDEGYFGSAVILTARISMAAGANEILVSAACAADAGVVPRHGRRFHLRKLKGFGEPQSLLSMGSTPELLVERDPGPPHVAEAAALALPA